MRMESQFDEMGGAAGNFVHPHPSLHSDRSLLKQNPPLSTCHRLFWCFWKMLDNDLFFLYITGWFGNFSQRGGRESSQFPKLFILKISLKSPKKLIKFSQNHPSWRAPEAVALDHGCQVLVPLGLPLEGSHHVGRCVPRDCQLHQLHLLRVPVDDDKVRLLGSRCYVPCLVWPRKQESQYAILVDCSIGGISILANLSIRRNPCQSY